MDNSEDDIFSEEWTDNPADDPDYTPEVKESPSSSETGSGWSSQKIDVRNMIFANSSPSLNSPVASLFTLIRGGC